MSIDDVLALLNDCDMLAASEAYQSEFRKSSSPNGETK